MPSAPTEQRDRCHAAVIQSGHSSNGCPKRNKAERVTQCGRNAIPETVTHPLQRSKNLSQANLFQRTGQKTAVQAPNLKDKKKEITWETNE